MQVFSVARTARWFHTMFPFAELRTAEWILSRYGHAELPVAKLFGYDLALKPRTSVHVLLYLERERFVEDAIFLGPYIREGMTAFDIGANIGYLTLLLCREVGPTGHVFAFEPEPENFRELVQNVEKNRISFCVPLQLAVGATDCRVALALGLNGYVQTEAAMEPKCRMVSLDSFVKQHGIPEVDLVKIDVEGHELDVLLGMSKVIDHDRPILYVEVHPLGFCGRGNPEEVCSFLQRYYHRIVVYRTWGEVRGQLSNLKKLWNTFVPTNHIRKRCETTLDQVRACPTGRFQLLCLPEERQDYCVQYHRPTSEL
jgi:FkbM family methyltransferase